MIERIGGQTSGADSLRTHLLDIERLDSKRLTELREEVTHMFATKLTRWGRTWWILGLCSSVLFSMFGAVVLLHSPLDESLTLIWWTYTLANIAMIGFSSYVLWRGVFDVRWALTLSKFSPAASLFIALLLIIRAVSEPSLPALAWSVFGLLCFSMAIAITLYNRVITAEMAGREQLLRLELRLIELTERLSGNPMK